MDRFFPLIGTNSKTSSKFDDRFARQNRYEPPPEFPLASPYSGIVHHLSGPNSYALTQIHPINIRIGRSCPPPRERSDLRSLSLRVRVLHPNTRIDVRLLGPCFKTGGIAPLCQHPRRNESAAALGPHTQHLQKAITLRGATFQLSLSCNENRCWPRKNPERRPREATMRKSHVEPNTLPFQQFHVLFHSLFKVLFIFPSQYLFAIGLSPIFSLRWNLPPT